MRISYTKNIIIDDISDKNKLLFIQKAIMKNNTEKTFTNIYFFIVILYGKSNLINLCFRLKK